MDKPRNEAMSTMKILTLLGVSLITVKATFADVNLDSTEIPMNQSLPVSELPLEDMNIQARSLRLITGHTGATLPKGSYELAIQHRFGEIGSGAENLYGIDNLNSMRIGFDYGLFDRLTLGVGRSSLRKTGNAYVKWRFLGKEQSPFTVTYLADAAMDGRKTENWGLSPFFATHRLNYTHQVIFSYCYKNNFQVALAPTIVHFNLVDKEIYSNDVPAIGLQARKLITNHITLTLEANQVIDGIVTVKAKTNPTIGFGFEYFTSRHVFQVNLTNARTLNEPYFMVSDNVSTEMNSFCLGFNLIRRW
jgi:hypothetical protein